jgi:DNA excision repair protein ERCC-4
MARRKTKPAADQPAFPCMVIIDQQEKLPYSFAHIKADASQGEGFVAVRTEVGHLKTGDYSLAGYEHRVACERKSMQDLFGTIGQGRERFERELVRLNGMQFACVVVEAEWSEIFADPPRHSQLSPRTVWRSYLAWEQRYVNVKWKFLPGREFAEVATFRTLERFWKERVKEAGEGMVTTEVGVELVVAEVDGTTTEETTE